ncbi:hypothetical protein [Carp edema virus]|nr:hypothetical protein [Carp edema virus]
MEVALDSNFNLKSVLSYKNNDFCSVCSSNCVYCEANVSQFFSSAEDPFISETSYIFKMFKKNGKLNNKAELDVFDTIEDPKFPTFQYRMNTQIEFKSMPTIVNEQTQFVLPMISTQKFSMKLENKKLYISDFIEDRLMQQPDGNTKIKGFDIWFSNYVHMQINFGIDQRFKKLLTTAETKSKTKAYYIAGNMFYSDAIPFAVKMADLAPSAFLLYSAENKLLQNPRTGSYYILLKPNKKAFNKKCKKFTLAGSFDNPIINKCNYLGSQIMFTYLIMEVNQKFIDIAKTDPVEISLDEFWPTESSSKKKYRINLVNYDKKIYIMKNGILKEFRFDHVSQFDFDFKKLTIFKDIQFNKDSDSIHKLNKAVNKLSKTKEYLTSIVQYLSEMGVVDCPTVFEGTQINTIIESHFGTFNFNNNFIKTRANNFSIAKTNQDDLMFINLMDLSQLRKILIELLFTYYSNPYFERASIDTEALQSKLGIGLNLIFFE